MKLFKYTLFYSSLLFSVVVWCLPRTTVMFSKNDAGFTRAKIKNETKEKLACYIGIDGYNIKFQLGANASSKWVTATDKRFNYQNFSTWCDYLEIHPEYKKYQAY